MTAAIARRRQSLAAEVLAGLPRVAHPSSCFLWLPLTPDSRRRVAVATAEPFATTPTVPHALRPALGSVGPTELRGALEAGGDAFR